MSFGFGFALPAYPLRGGGGNNPFNQLGPTLDLSFTGVVTDLTDPNGYTLNTDFIIPQYQIAAQYVVWETGVGLVDKTFSQIITFTRASIGTYFDSAGVLQTATSGTPRFDYDPVTLAPRGFLIEEARTNLVLRSAEFSNPYWLLSRATISADVVSAPDGTTTADKLVEDTTAASTHYVYANNVSVTAATTYTFTVFLKAAERTFASIDIADGTGANGGAVGVNLTSGTIGTPFARGTGSNVGATISAINNGWYRVSITAQLGAAATTCDCAIYTATSLLTSGYPATNGDGVSGIYVWGAQLEAGAFPTSYIPTTTGTVPRNADVASVNTLSPWYNATEGTVYAEFSTFATTTGFGGAWGFGDNTLPFANAEAIYVARTNATNSTAQTVIDNGVSQGAISSGSGVAPNTVGKVASTYKLNDVAVSVNGAAVGVDPTVTIPTVTVLSLGSLQNAWSGGGNYINGWLRRITYYPRRLTNDELRTISLPTGATITTQDYSLDTNFVGNTVAIGS